MDAFKRHRAALSDKSHRRNGLRNSYRRFGMHHDRPQPDTLRLVVADLAQSFFRKGQRWSGGGRAKRI